jgi:hypothetical protein
MMFFVLPKRGIFYQYGIVVVFPFSHLYTIHDHTFGQRILDKLWCYYRNILDAHSWLHFGSLHCLSRIYIPNFVHHHFPPRRLQKLGYLPCIPRQVFLRFFFFLLAMGHLVFVIFLLEFLNYFGKKKFSLFSNIIVLMTIFH